jgi:hypothetical protein
MKRRSIEREELAKCRKGKKRDAVKGGVGEGAAVDDAYNA